MQQTRDDTNRSSGVEIVSFVEGIESVSRGSALGIAQTFARFPAIYMSRPGS